MNVSKGKWLILEFKYNNVKLEMNVCENGSIEKNRKRVDIILPLTVKNFNCKTAPDHSYKIGPAPSLSE